MKEKKTTTTRKPKTQIKKEKRRRVEWHSDGTLGGCFDCTSQMRNIGLGQKNQRTTNVHLYGIIL